MDDANPNEAAATPPRADPNPKLRPSPLKTVESAALLVLAVVVAYAWCARISRDLIWDEGHNLRVYARHPAAALGLYREPNNHVVDSFVKSVFYSCFGLSDPAFYRFAGFLWILAFGAVVLGFRRAFLGSGARVAATFSVVLLLLARHAHYHAMYLRGYFPSIVFAALYGLVLLRSSNLATFGEPPPWTRRRAALFGALSALLLWTVPTNAFVLPALWPATLGAFALRDGGGGSRLRATLKAAALLFGTTVLFTAVLYAPIFVGLATGVSDLHNVPAKDPSPFSEALSVESERLAAFASPEGVDAASFAIFCGVLFLGAGAAALRDRARRRAFGVAVLFALGAGVASIGSALLTNWPDRARSPYLGAVAVALALAAHVATTGLPKTAARFVSAAIAAGALAFLPAIAGEVSFHREATNAATLARGVARADERRTLVCHDDQQDLYFPIRNAFGASRTIASRRELEDRFAGAPTRADYPEGSWKRRLRDAIFPKPPIDPIDLDAVDALVFVGADYLDSGAAEWRHPDLDRLRARLSKETRYAAPPYVVVLRERP